MRSLNFFASLGIVAALAFGAPQVSLGQYSINSIAGGGPNGLLALRPASETLRASLSTPKAMPTSLNPATQVKF